MWTRSAMSTQIRTSRMRWSQRTSQQASLNLRSSQGKRMTEMEFHGLMTSVRAIGATPPAALAALIRMEMVGRISMKHARRCGATPSIVPAVRIPMGTDWLIRTMGALWRLVRVYTPSSAAPMMIQMVGRTRTIHSLPTPPSGMMLMLMESETIWMNVQTHRIPLSTGEAARYRMKIPTFCFTHQ